MKPLSFEATLLLYSTTGCHLCEQAEALIRQTIAVPLEVVDIADDWQLLEQYGVRIPVLRRSDTGQELDWPFNGETLNRWWAV